MKQKLNANGLRVPRKTLINDFFAGLVMSIIQVPGAVGNGVLAGVNPVFGLYSMIVGTSIAAVFTSSVIMNVDSTSATAIATGDLLTGMDSSEQMQRLIVLGVLVGIFQLAFGLLRLGSLVRYISNAVMTGFLSGLGILTILGQVGDLTGYASRADNKVLRTIDTILHPTQIHWPSLAIGVVTMVTIWLVERTRFGRYSYLVGLGLASIAALLWSQSSIVLVGDTTSIPRSLPMPHFPEIALVGSMLIPAFAIAIIALVQAAGVSQSVPNPDGEYPDPSGDFRGQGIANVAVGISSGIPVGGSLSGTTLIQTVGGQSRWANLFTGIFGAVLVLLFAPQLERLPMPALAGLLIMVGISMINVPRIRIVRNTGAVPLGVMLTTLTATLFLPIQYAVAVGVILHIVLYVYQSAETVRIERIVPQPDGTYAESVPPEALVDDDIVILQPVGSLFFAGAAEFEEHLPDVGEATGSVVIVTLRDRDEVGSTFIRIMERYANELHAQQNLLMLVGVDDRVLAQLERTELLDLIGRENVFLAEATYGAALQDALHAAEEWQSKH
jgi:SulP family sulfate permease